MKKVVLGSKPYNVVDQATGVVTVMYRIGLSDGTFVNSQHDVPAGHGVLVSAKTAGTQYIDSEGKPQTVRRTGFTLDLILGNEQQIRSVSATAKALAELV